MWDVAYRSHIGLMHATSAHNQFLQSLGTAGIAGLIGSLVYRAILLRYVINRWRDTQGLSVALFVIVPSRCTTETPPVVEAIMTRDFLTHLVLFHIALLYGHRKSVPERFAPPAIAHGGAS